MRATIVALLLLAMTGCGQKGPLYFAEPETSPAADAASATTSEQDNEEEAGEPTP